MEKGRGNVTEGFGQWIITYPNLIWLPYFCHHDTNDMAQKEAKARIKIDRLLHEAGWRFFEENGLPANIQLEAGTRISKAQLDALGDNFEKSQTGRLDYLLLDERGFPYLVLEAKAAHIHPLSAKEQARRYADSQNCRFVILSNGDVHYFWDLKTGDPQPIHVFPGPEEAVKFAAFNPQPERLAAELVGADFVARTQMPHFDRDPRWTDETQRRDFLKENGLRLLRDYQLQAIHAIQEAVKKGKNRFLFEMATGTGKTLTAAAAAKLFLKTDNARRVLFLVDRIELENQAEKDLSKYLKNDYDICIFKQQMDGWRKCNIVISTVQTLLAGNRFKRVFQPADFDLVISDEAHRSIGGNSREVFEYFIGYKLGLTATPRDYLKKTDKSALHAGDPRELERRLLLDTYTTFGCDDGIPTFRFSLLDGVKAGVLINPKVLDARTDVTTQLLSDQGFLVTISDDEGNQSEENYRLRDFEKNFFSERTNRLFCKTFLDHAQRDPVTGEIGKTIVFAVSQKHAAKIAHELNKMATALFPGKYDSDFAMQVTSQVPGAQDMTTDFANNALRGHSRFNPLYPSSKTRVCVTVGMMTTGYDCPDILNLCLMRPIFSPTDFVQIKGRGTRLCDFSEIIKDRKVRAEVGARPKQHFNLFDFFANCEYFEEKFDYDQQLNLPALNAGKTDFDADNGKTSTKSYETYIPDQLRTVQETQIGSEGMKIDRMLYGQFEETARADEYLKALAKNFDWPAAEQYVLEHLFEKPNDFINLEKLRRALGSDRRVSLTEILQLIFGAIPYIKNRRELLSEEFNRFDSRFKPDENEFDLVRRYFEAYLLDPEFRAIVDSRQFARLATHPAGQAFKAVPEKWRHVVPEYVKDYVPINQFLS